MGTFCVIPPLHPCAAFVRVFLELFFSTNSPPLPTEAFGHRQPAFSTYPPLPFSPPKDVCCAPLSNISNAKLASIILYLIIRRTGRKLCDVCAFSLGEGSKCGRVVGSAYMYGYIERGDRLRPSGFHSMVVRVRVSVGCCCSPWSLSMYSLV